MRAPAVEEAEGARCRHQERTEAEGAGASSCQLSRSAEAGVREAEEAVEGPWYQAGALEEEAVAAADSRSPA